LEAQEEVASEKEVEVAELERREKVSGRRRDS